VIDPRHLISKGVHFGHQSSRRNPKMRPYIWGRKNGIDIIDVTKTARQIEKAAAFLKQVASEGKSILWCGTKKAAAQIIEQAGKATDSPAAAFRWIGGTLTNNVQVKKSVTKLCHLEDVLAKGGEHHTKKELGIINKQVNRARRNVGGLQNLTWPIGALVIVDVRKDNVAVREAVQRGIPIVGLVDTNVDPSDIKYAIPGNDDSKDAIACVLENLVTAVLQGKAFAREQIAQKLQEAAERAAESSLVVPTHEEEKSVLQAQLEAVEAALGGSEEEKARARQPVAARTRRPASGGGGERRGPGGAPRQRKTSKE
jgi:small subunit ribosomal protein S2